MKRFNIKLTILVTMLLGSYSFARIGGGGYDFEGDDKPHTQMLIDAIKAASPTSPAKTSAVTACNVAMIVRALAVRMFENQNIAVTQEELATMETTELTREQLECWKKAAAHAKKFTEFMNSHFVETKK